MIRGEYEKKKKLDFPQKSHRGGVRIAAMHNSQAGYLHSVDRVYRGRKVDRGGRKDARRPRSEEIAQKGMKREYRRGLESLKVEGIIPLKPRDGIKLAELMFKGQFQRRTPGCKGDVTHYRIGIFSLPSPSLGSRRVSRQVRYLR